MNNIAIASRKVHLTALGALGPDELIVDVFGPVLRRPMIAAVPRFVAGC
jgi:hypothetical protein